VSPCDTFRTLILLETDLSNADPSSSFRLPSGKKSRSSLKVSTPLYETVFTLFVWFRLSLSLGKQGIFISFVCSVLYLFCLEWFITFEDKYVWIFLKFSVNPFCCNLALSIRFIVRSIGVPTPLLCNGSALRSIIWQIRSGLQV